MWITRGHGPSGGEGLGGGDCGEGVSEGKKEDIGNAPDNKD